MAGYMHSDCSPSMEGIREGNNSSHSNSQLQPTGFNGPHTVSPQALDIGGQGTLPQPVGNDWTNMIPSAASVTGTVSSSSAHDGNTPPRPSVLPGAGHPLTAVMLERLNQMNSDENNVNMRIIRRSLRAKKDKASATRVSSDSADLGWVSQPTPFDSEVFAAGAWSDTPPEVHDAGVGAVNDGAEDLFLAK